MKRSIFAVPALLLSLLLVSCNEGGETVTGAPEVILLPGPIFTITSKAVEGSSMVVRGLVMNSDKKAWAPTWYVEAQFYTDSNYTIKLGGANKSFSYSLEENASAKWELRFTPASSDLNASFAARNFRAFRNQ